MPENNDWQNAVEVLAEQVPSRPLARRLRVLEQYRDAIETYIEMTRREIHDERLDEPRSMPRKDALTMAGGLGHRMRRHSKCAQCGAGLWRIVEGAEEGIGGRIVGGVECPRAFEK